MEGNYYLCGWRSSDSGFEVWVLKSPRVKATSTTFEAADELLGEKICDRYGDGESKREYVPSPRLKSGRKRFLVSVWGDISIEAVNGFELFLERRCGVCRAVLGSRTKMSAKIEKSPRRRNGFFLSSGHVMHVFSQSFVNVIEDRSQIQLVWRPILSAGGGQGEWLELIGGNFVREVVPKNRHVSGWRCSTCGITRILAYGGSDGLRTHVAASDFPKQVPGIFPIKQLRGISLGMTDEIWSKIRKRPEAKGVMSQALGLVSDTDISNLAQLESYEAYQAEPHPVTS